MFEELESLDFDIVFVGAGPANLFAALWLQRLVARHREAGGADLSPSVAVIDKGRHGGAHLLSGALLDPRPILECFPEWLGTGFPSYGSVTREKVWFLGSRKRVAIPFLPESFGNEGMLMVSLSRLGAWMGEQALAAGIELFHETAAVEPVVSNGRLRAIRTDSKGVGRDGMRKASFLPGLLLGARTFVIGEGAAGSVTRALAAHFPERFAMERQRYETGVRECWRVPEGRINTGEVHHAFGYPLGSHAYGGGWLYAFSPTLLSLGYVASPGRLDPACDPQLLLQRFKQHPWLQQLLEGGSMLEAGARTLTSGGFDALPRMSGPGYLLTGESAGLVDMQRHKGLHLAMLSGMIVAETLFEGLLRDDFSEGQLARADERFAASWGYREMEAARFFRSGFDKGLYAGLVQAGLRVSFPGFGPGKKREEGKSPVAEPLEPFHPDEQLTFGRESWLFRSGVAHEEDQPVHLQLSEESVNRFCLERCGTEFGYPCLRFCPAGVYEIVTFPEHSLLLHASNCLHCKTCEVADPYGIVRWMPPEGGGGPGYRMS